MGTLICFCIEQEPHKFILNFEENTTVFQQSTSYLKEIEGIRNKILNILIARYSELFVWLENIPRHLLKRTGHTATRGSTLMFLYRGGFRRQGISNLEEIEVFLSTVGGVSNCAIQSAH